MPYKHPIVHSGQAKQQTKGQMLAQIATSHQRNVYLAYTWQLAGTSSYKQYRGGGNKIQWRCYTSMLDWNDVMHHGIYIFHSNTQLYCVAICLLIYSSHGDCKTIASCRNVSHTYCTVIAYFVDVLSVL